MKVYKILLLSLFTTLLIPLESEAQRDVYDWQITPYAGLLTVNNDISFPKNTKMFAYGLRLERRLGNDFTFGLHFSQLDLDDAVQNNISGGFLSLAYHWDNGYLLSQRSFLSVFHRIEIGYADRYSTFESINSKSADFAVGFENGLKFRLGDRISTDLSLEIFSSKASLTTGDITENIRYNVWKVGVTYHFGSRKSNYVAPVFVPRTSIPARLDKMQSKGETIWIVHDSIYNDEVKLKRLEKIKVDSLLNPKLSRADSLQIFMYFDSMYERRTPNDTLVSYVDSMAVDSMAVDVMVLDSARMDSIAIQEYDSLNTDSLVSPVDSSKYSLRTPKSIFSPIDSSQYVAQPSDTLLSPVDSSQYILRSTQTLVSPIDSSQYLLRSTDSIVSPIDTTKYIQKSSDSRVIPVDSAGYVAPGAVIIPADTMKSKTVAVSKAASVDSSAILRPVVTDTVIIQKTDTVYMNKPNSKDILQKADTSAQRNIIENGQARVDTLYIVKDAVEPRQKSVDSAERSNEEIKEVVKKNTTAQTQTTNNQDAKIASLEAEIDRLKKKNKRDDTGKVIAAGAAGAVLGSAASKDKNRKSEKDTVFVVSTEGTGRIDSLQSELDSLRQVYGISASPVASSNSIVDPPIGMYFANKDTSSALLPDTAYSMTADSLALKKDSFSSLNGDILNKDVEKTYSDSLDLSRQTAKPVVVAKPDTSAAKTNIEAEKPKAEESKTVDLKGKYPIKCNFELNATTLDKGELEQLDVVIDDLKKSQNRKVELTGYTDKSGNADYNLQLSKKRANAVSEYLVSKGVNANRIKINAGGVLSSAERYSADARRVEVRIVE